MTFCPRCRCTPCTCSIPSAGWIRENVGCAKGINKQPGGMNKTETRYAEYLRFQREGGLILWWRFEAITLKLGHDCRFTPDFMVMRVDGVIELIDVKGTTKTAKGKAKAYSEDDARVKIAAAAEQFPFVFRRAFEANGGWQHDEFSTAA